MEEKNKRSKWLHVRLNEDEHNKITKAFKGTTEIKLSEYVRKIILKKPMIAAVRNQSLQDILTVLFKLRSDLNGLANNFNQAVKKLHTLRDERAIAQHLLQLRIEERQLLKNIEEMKIFIAKAQEKWLQG